MILCAFRLYDRILSTFSRQCWKNSIDCRRVDRRCSGVTFSNTCILWAWSPVRYRYQLIFTVSISKKFDRMDDQLDVHHAWERNHVVNLPSMLNINTRKVSDEPHQRLTNHINRALFRDHWTLSKVWLRLELQKHARCADKCYLQVHIINVCTTSAVTDSGRQFTLSHITCIHGIRRYRAVLLPGTDSCCTYG